ncbi:MAG: Ku protein [Myxococcota bacterium]
MAARAVGSGTISFGLVSIPIKLYVAASPQNVRFNQLHAECGSRIKMQMYCPVCDKTLERDDIVKGYEYARGQYVRFDEEELKALEAEKTHSLDIVEFVPLASVDLVQVDKSYYLGPDKGGDKAYRMLSEAMERTGKVAVGRFWTRGKEQLVLVRPYKEGLLLHYLYYADEVRDFAEVDRGDDVKYRPGELEMAEQLVEQLSTEGLDASKFRDEYRDRVMQAVEQKVAGEEVTMAPEPPQAQVVDLFEALKASLDKGTRKVQPEAGAEAKPARKAKGGPKKAQPRGSKRKKKTSTG